MAVTLLSNSIRIKHPYYSMLQRYCCQCDITNINSSFVYIHLSRLYHISYYLAARMLQMLLQCRFRFSIDFFESRNSHSISLIRQFRKLWCCRQIISTIYYIYYMHVRLQPRANIKFCSINHFFIIFDSLSRFL